MSILTLVMLIVAFVLLHVSLWTLVIKQSVCFSYREWILSWLLSHFGNIARFKIRTWVWVRKSTESLSFLGVFLVQESCHPRNYICDHFFTKLILPSCSQGLKTSEYKISRPSSSARAHTCFRRSPRVYQGRRWDTSCARHPMLPRQRIATSSRIHCHVTFTHHHPHHLPYLFFSPNHFCHVSLQLRQRKPTKF
jgi:hypothetical protein